MEKYAMDDEGVEREIISRKEALEKDLDRYFTGKACKYGHVSERYVKSSACIECMKEYVKEYQKSDKRKEYMKEYYQNNKEYMKEYQKGYYQNNKESIKEYMKEYRKEYYQNNKEYMKEYQKGYYQNNKESIKEYWKEYQKERRKTDTDFRLMEQCRRILHRTLNSTNQTKNNRTVELLGYNHEDLKQHLESLFQPDMEWDNTDEWHIDHKYPVSRYIKDGITDPSIINALDNLIPMWAEHNMEKGDMTLEEYLDMRPDLMDLYGRFL